MANFLVSSLDGKLSLPVKASNAKEAAIEAMNTWGSKLKSKVEVKNVKLDPSLNLIRARQEYTCDCCGAKINKGDFYYRKPDCKKAWNRNIAIILGQSSRTNL